MVELLGQGETRDELGLGTIRDAFAEALFPGMNTVQRRARYFLFVPWIFHLLTRLGRERAEVLASELRLDLRPPARAP